MLWKIRFIDLDLNTPAKKVRLLLESLQVRSCCYSWELWESWRSQINACVCTYDLRHARVLCTSYLRLARCKILRCEIYTLKPSSNLSSRSKMIALWVSFSMHKITKSFVIEEDLTAGHRTVEAWGKSTLGSNAVVIKGNPIQPN